MSSYTDRTYALSMLRIVLLVGIGGTMLTGCAGFFGPSETTSNFAAPSQFARVSEIQDNTDIPDELLYPKKLPRLDDQDRERLGDTLLKRGEFPGAFIQYEKVLADEPDNLRVMYKKGLTLLYGQQYQETVNVLEGLVSRNPRHAPAHSALGQAYLELGQLPASESHLRTALTLNPLLWNAHNLLGNIYDYQQRYGDAIQEYQAALDIKPSDAKLQNNLGVSYLLDKNFPLAVQALEAAIDNGSRDRQVYNNLGVAYAGMQDMDRALQAFRQGGTNAQAYNNIGCLYMSQKNYAQAIDAFEKAIALSPQFYAKASENLRQAQYLASNQAQ
jgi:tetratricopeptide (TPR) repeat protein